MTFRRIYWVTEQLAENNVSCVTGVYTSIPDLLQEGLRWAEGCELKTGMRLSLVKLDDYNMPLGTWTSPEFKGIKDDLQPYVQTQEFTGNDVEMLEEELQKFFKS